MRRADRLAGGALLLALGLGACARDEERDGADRAEPARYSGNSTLLDRASEMPEPRLAAPVRVAIVRDAANRAFFADASALDTTSAAWTRALRAAAAAERTE